MQAQKADEINPKQSKTVKDKQVNYVQTKEHKS